MRFSGVTLDLVPIVKPVSPVAADKTDIYLRCFSTYISSGAGAYDQVIDFGPFFSYYVLIDYLSNVTINVLYSYVS